MRRAVERAQFPRGADFRALETAVAALGTRQDGVLTRRQVYESGLSPAHVKAQIAARRWQGIGRRVLVLHNTALTARQREWVAVLLPGIPAALAGLTAARGAGLTGFEPARVHIVVRHDTHTRLPSWVQLHESRRFDAGDIRAGGGPPRTGAARSVIDAAAWSISPRRAAAIVCASVQQRVTTAEALREELAGAGQVRHARLLNQILGDVSDGGHTLAEIDLGPLARRAGLPPPRRQVLCVEPAGRRRYLDAEFDLPDGHTLAVEVDGSVHLQPSNWWDDLSRQNEITIGGRIVLRFPSVAIRSHPDAVVDQLRRIRLAHCPQN
jgi:hypothetical protein